MFQSVTIQESSMEPTLTVGEKTVCKPWDL